MNTNFTGKKLQVGGGEGKRAGCCSYPFLKTIFQKKYQVRLFSKKNQKSIKFVCFRKRRDNSRDLFEKHKILSIYELHVYELLKTALMSITKFYSENRLFFTFSVLKTTLCILGDHLKSCVSNPLQIKSWKNAPCVQEL